MPPYEKNQDMSPPAAEEQDKGNQKVMGNQITSASSFFRDDDELTANTGALLSTTDNAHSWGRGIVKDFRATVGTHWWSEMRNLNSKTVAVSFFLFIAVIAPSITFGAVYAKRTNNYMGAVELLLATAWIGIFYSLVAGMPMVRTENGKSGARHLCLHSFTANTDDQRRNGTRIDLSSCHVRTEQEFGRALFALQRLDWTLGDLLHALIGLF